MQVKSAGGSIPQRKRFTERKWAIAAETSALVPNDLQFASDMVNVCESAGMGQVEAPVGVSGECVPGNLRRPLVVADRA